MEVGFCSSNISRVKLRNEPDLVKVFESGGIDKHLIRNGDIGLAQDLVKVGD